MASYLPYGLRIGALKDYEGIRTMVCTGSNSKEVNIEAVSRLGYKPILRPLSDLTKEIEHDGQKFVPFEHINRVMIRQWSDSCERYIDAALDDMANIDNHILKCPFDMIQIFCKWHFDIFSLIDAGLAIDINTLP